MKEWFGQCKQTITLLYNTAKITEKFKLIFSPKSVIIQLIKIFFCLTGRRFSQVIIVVSLPCTAYFYGIALYVQGAAFIDAVQE